MECLLTPLFFVGRLPPMFLRVVAVVDTVGVVTTDERDCETDVIPPCQLLLSTRLIHVLPKISQTDLIVQH